MKTAMGHANVGVMQRATKLGGHLVALFLGMLNLNCPQLRGDSRGTQVIQTDAVSSSRIGRSSCRHRHKGTHQNNVPLQPQPQPPEKITGTGPQAQAQTQIIAWRAALCPCSA